MLLRDHYCLSLWSRIWDTLSLYLRQQTVLYTLTLAFFFTARCMRYIQWRSHHFCDTGCVIAFFPLFSAPISWSKHAVGLHFPSLLYRLSSFGDCSHVYRSCDLCKKCTTTQAHDDGHLLLLVHDWARNHWEITCKIIVYFPHTGCVRTLRTLYCLHHWTEVSLHANKFSDVFTRG